MCFIYNQWCDICTCFGHCCGTPGGSALQRIYYKSWRTSAQIYNPHQLAQCMVMDYLKLSYQWFWNKTDIHAQVKICAFCVYFIYLTDYLVWSKHVVFVLNKVALRQVFLWVLQLPSFQYHSTIAPHSFICPSPLLYNLSCWQHKYVTCLKWALWFIFLKCLLSKWNVWSP